MKEIIKVVVMLCLVFYWVAFGALALTGKLPDGASDIFWASFLFSGMCCFFGIIDRLITIEEDE